MAWRVFLVEDLRSMHVLLADLFATIGSIEIVDACTTEAEARLWLDEHPGAWDLAIIDLVLAQGSGMGLVAHARRTGGPGAKVVVFSGYASPGIRAHCLALGADAVFEKTETRQFISWLSLEARGAGH
ncbi:response regulator [Ramlibacter sp. PS3R-8]|uniref:response regulator n=1 Tax=Ramlibacter sp. PS3R-8 TaxID=3133437 RepID=UPI0030B27BD5